jgi:hypothetical protein
VSTVQVIGPSSIGVTAKSISSLSLAAVLIRTMQDVTGTPLTPGTEPLVN